MASLPVANSYTAGCVRGFRARWDGDISPVSQFRTFAAIALALAIRPHACELVVSPRRWRSLKRATIRWIRHLVPEDSQLRRAALEAVLRMLPLAGAVGDGQVIYRRHLRKRDGTP